MFAASISGKKKSVICDMCIASPKVSHTSRCTRHLYTRCMWRSLFFILLPTFLTVHYFLCTSPDVRIIWAACRHNWRSWGKFVIAWLALLICAFLAHETWIRIHHYFDGFRKCLFSELSTSSLQLLKAIKRYVSKGIDIIFACRDFLVKLVAKNTSELFSIPRVKEEKERKRRRRRRRRVKRRIRRTKRTRR